MALSPVSPLYNAAQIKLSFTVPGRGSLRKAISNSMTYYTPTGPSVAWTAAQFLSAWVSQSQTQLLACIDFSCILAEYTVIDLMRPNFAQYNTYPALHGTYNMTPGAPAASVNTAFCYLKTYQRGRGSWGGIHQGGLPQVGILGNEFTGAYQMILDAYLAQFTGSFVDGAGLRWNIALLSRQQSSLSPPPPAVNVALAAIDPTQCAWDDNVRTLRKRSEGLVRA